MVNYTPDYNTYPDTKYNDFKNGECPSCGKKWFKQDQEICEGCGVALSRM